MTQLTIANRVAETVVNAGTSDFSLLGAVAAAWQTFSAGCGNGVTAPYCAVHRTSGQWEVGYGITGAATLTRATVLNNSSGGTSKINFSSGIVDVFLGIPASKMVVQDADSARVTLPASLFANGDITADGGADADTTLTVGHAGTSPTATRTALLKLIAPDSGSFRGVVKTLLQRAAGVVWAVGLAASAAGASTATTDYIFDPANSGTPVAALSTGGVFTAAGFVGPLTGNISGSAPAGSLTGTVLAANVVTSSLTTVGTLGSLAVTAGITSATLVLGTDPNGTQLLRVGGAAKITGAILGTNATNSFGNQTGADATLQIGPDTPVSARSTRLALFSSSTQYNWFVAANWNVADGLEFTPTTAAGGTTMSGTPLVTMRASTSRVGILQISPSYTLDITGTFGVSGAAVCFSTLTTGGVASFNAGAVAAIGAANTVSLNIDNVGDDKPMIGFRRGGTLRSVLRLVADNDFRLLSSNLSTAAALTLGAITAGGAATLNSGVVASLGVADTPSLNLDNTADDKPMIGFRRGGTIRSVLRLLTDNDFRLLAADLTTPAALTVGDFTVASGGVLTLGNARVASVQVQGGYVTMKDSAGTTIKVLTT